MQRSTASRSGRCRPLRILPSLFSTKHQKMYSTPMNMPVGNGETPLLRKGSRVAENNSLGVGSPPEGLQTRKIAIASPTSQSDKQATDRRGGRLASSRSIMFQEIQVPRAASIKSVIATAITCAEIMTSNGFSDHNRRVVQSIHSTSKSPPTRNHQLETSPTVLDRSGIVIAPPSANVKQDGEQVALGMWQYDDQRPGEESQDHRERHDQDADEQPLRHLSLAEDREPGMAGRNTDPDPVLTEDSGPEEAGKSTSTIQARPDITMAGPPVSIRPTPGSAPGHVSRQRRWLRQTRGRH